MTKTPIAFALSLVLAAAAGSAMAMDDMKSGKSARSTNDATMPAGMDHHQTNSTLGQGSGVRAETHGEMKAEQRVDQRADKPVNKPTLGQTGRGQGSGTVMSNRAEEKAQMRDDQRADVPVKKAATGTTGEGRGSGVREDATTMHGSKPGMSYGKDSSSTTTR